MWGRDGGRGACVRGGGAQRQLTVLQQELSDKSAEASLGALARWVGPGTARRRCCAGYAGRLAVTHAGEGGAVWRG